MIQNRRVCLIGVVFAVVVSGSIPLSNAFLGNCPSSTTRTINRSNEGIATRTERTVRTFAEDSKSKNKINANDMMKTDETLASLQIFLDKVSALSKQLKIMESKLRDNRREWVKEKIILTRKIAVLTELLQEQNENVREINSQSEAASSTVPSESEDSAGSHQSRLESLERDLNICYEREEDLVYEQDRLEREVHILQTEIVRVQNLYRTEQNKLQEAMGELEEYQQRDESWSNLVDDQERQIKELQAKLQNFEQQGESHEDGVSVDQKHEK